MKNMVKAAARGYNPCRQTVEQLGPPLLLDSISEASWRLQ